MSRYDPKNTGENYKRAMWIRSNHALRAWANSLSYNYILIKYFNKNPYLTYIFRDFNDMLSLKYLPLHLTVFCLSLIIAYFALPTLISIAIAFVITVIIMVSHYTLVIQTNKIKSHLQLATQHEELIDEGLEIIFRDKPKVTSFL